MYWCFFVIVNKDNTGSLKWSYLRPQARTPQEYLGETEFRVEMVKQTDKVSKILYRQNVKLRKEKLQAGRYETDRLGTIFSEFPFPIDTTHIRVLRGDIEILNIPVLSEPPSVKLDSKKINPKGEQEIRWSIQTKEGYSTWSSLFIEIEGVRYPIASKIRQTHLKVNFEKLPGCKRGRIIVFVSTGFYTAEDSTEEFSLPFRPPVALITFPRNGQELPAGQVFQLRGQGLSIQPQQRFLDTDLQWYIDGNLIGSGRICLTPQLKLGKHTVSLRVKDDLGNVGEGKIEVIVTRQPKIVGDKGPGVRHK